MPLTMWRGARLLAVWAVLAAGSPSPSMAQSFWPINGVSGEVTGTTTTPFAVGDAPSAEEQMPAGLAQMPTGQVASDAPAAVDESALRYFARQGDTRRLQIEIARLRALYPQWTPPADPLAAPVNVDAGLEAIWQLYSEGRLAEVREAIAKRQSDEPGWQPPADLLDRLGLAEARERLINASNIDQYETVVRVASENPHLLTCSEVDVLWRVAEAFARTDRQPRARDAYRYILTNCSDPQERLATVQNASQLLDQPLLDELLALERSNAAGAGEFESVRDDIARNLVAKAGRDSAASVPPEQLSLVEQLATEGGAASDARLLGWYYLQRANHAEAEKWFRMARAKEDTADGSEGLALALMAQGKHAEAEDVIYPWRGEGENTRKVYLAAAANLLGMEPRPVLSAEVLARIVAEVAAARDVPAARQLGWYARAWEQHQTAAQWFTTALGWDGQDEPSAYGLALTRQVLGDGAGLAEIKRAWAGRSERIAQVGTDAGRRGSAAPVPATPDPQRTSSSTASPPAAPADASGPAPAARPHGARAAVAGGGSCHRGHINPATLSAEAALRQGWCLMDANRPMEAVAAFEAASRSASSSTVRDAAWGKSLAYLRMELVDDAAVAAVSAPQDARRANELQTAILAQRAAGAFEGGRYMETLIALDQRAQIAPERIDLMVLRGYAYMNLNRLNDAHRIFQALAGTGDREGVKGLAIVNERLKGLAGD